MSKNRNQKPAARYNETVIEGQFDVRLLNTWEAASLIVYLGREERTRMGRIFRFQMQDLDINLKHISMCLDIGRAMDQRFRRDQGIQIDVELKRGADGISILLHVVTMFADDGRPRYVMAATDEKGQFLMEDGRQVMNPAAMTFERFFPNGRLDYLFDMAEDLSVAMQLRRIRRVLRSRGDAKTLKQLRSSMGHFQDIADETPVERLTATVGESAAKKSSGKKETIKAPKIAAATNVATADDVTEDLARKLTVGLGLEDPGAGLPTDDEGKTPEPVASAAPAPAPKPKKVKPQPIKLGTVEGNAKLAELGASNGSNGQS